MAIDHNIGIQMTQIELIYADFKLKKKLMSAAYVKIFYRG